MAAGREAELETDAAGRDETGWVPFRSTGALWGMEGLWPSDAAGGDAAVAPGGGSAFRGAAVMGMESLPAAGTATFAGERDKSVFEDGGKAFSMLIPEVWDACRTGRWEPGRGWRHSDHDTAPKNTTAKAANAALCTKSPRERPAILRGTICRSER